MTSLDIRNNLLHLYHAHVSILTSTDALNDTVFSPDESLQRSCNSFTVSKCLWETIPRHLEDDLITSISDLKLQMTGSRQKYVSQLFKYL